MEHQALINDLGAKAKKLIAEIEKQQNHIVGNRSAINHYGHKASSYSRNEWNRRITVAEERIADMMLELDFIEGALKHLVHPDAA